MESLMDIAILSGEDIGTYCTFSSIKYIIIIPSAAVQASYALQRAIGYLTNSDLSRLRCDALFFFPFAADSDVEVEHSDARRSPRSHGVYRQTMYTSEVSAIFSGITSGAHSFENATEVQLLGMCTVLHHILFQEITRPHVGPRTHHGLGTLLSQNVVSPADHAERQVLMVGLIQPTGIPNTQVRLLTSYNISSFLISIYSFNNTSSSQVIITCCINFGIIITSAGAI
jgi:hypothetical protein